jgi:hypothetical protein
MIARVAVIVLVVAACDSTPTPVECHNIPAGGCPQDNGADVCGGDMSCTAVYDCVNGGWVFDQMCPPRAHDASTDTGASDVTTPVSDVHLDAPPGSFGGPGCTDLETPDCSVGTALLCAGATDCCGCTDLWVCQNGAWVSWGTCGDAGVVQN